MSLQEDFNDFVQQQNDVQNEYEAYIRNMWKETAIDDRKFRNCIINKNNVERVISRYVEDSGASQFRKTLYLKLWNNLDTNVFGAWVDELNARLNTPNERAECLAKYVARVLRGELEPKDNRNVSEALKQDQCVWELAFSRLGSMCKNWRI